VAALFVGYSGYYVCRTVLPVASPGMLNDPTSGIDDIAYGRLGAFGIYLYAVGKLLNGVFTEYAGGRAMFLAGMVLSAAAVALFGLVAGLAAMIVLWSANRFVQSMGWGGLVQIAGRWFSAERLGTVMAVLSLSYLFGAAIAQSYLGLWAKAGVGWRDLFLIAAATLAIIALATALFLRGSPRAIGLPEPPPPPRNVFGDQASDTPVSLIKLLGPLLASPLFWLVCIMNMGLTSIRETFNHWTPRYLQIGVGLEKEDVGLLATIFPLCGAIACLAAGWLADRLRGRFGRLIVPLMAVTTAILWGFTNADLHGRPAEALTFISCIALCMMGPYTFCSGVMALNLGGQRAGAAAAGVIDAVGYFCGAIISGELAGHLVKNHGFAPLLDVLLGLSAITLAVGIAYWIVEEREIRRRNEP
jgi:OPA family glycerol-3-phosphate transporter-like MFS transporter